MRIVVFGVFAAIAACSGVDMAKGFQRVRSQPTAAGKEALNRREFKGPVQYVQNDVFLNRPGIISGQMSIPADLVIQGQDVAIPDGFSVLLKARSGNASFVRVAGDREAALSTDKVWEFTAGEMLEYKVQNLNQIWFGGTLGDIVMYTVEQDKPARKR